ncbi:protein of unknown function DUF159 [Comamonas testosteroni]|nr:protein of unknown function DUF159 [Comamonas testosteroni]
MRAPVLALDSHPLMSRMHKPDPKLPADQQDKRSVIPIEVQDIDQWLAGWLARCGRQGSCSDWRLWMCLRRNQPSFRILPVGCYRP